ncbi:MAG: wax ester/triacylglycerol synthase family O-acyltransferase [Deltaproteobacteria bacterium]|nr:wax ester/triacylglycerol synthase family O-acyltransferase [Deltaproteobacteria bacterium]
MAEAGEQERARLELRCCDARRDQRRARLAAAPRTQIYELGPLRTELGGVDFERVKAFIASVLHRIPRYRQKLAWIPIEQRPVWVDDAAFDLNYHVRHTALPKPGSEEQLKSLAGRVMAQHLDRERPLWELWVIDGLEGDRFAIISKIHHCMIDGMSGVDLSQILQSPDKSATEIGEAPRFHPRPAPTSGELLTDAVTWRLQTPLRALKGLRELQRETDDLRSEVEARIQAIRAMYGEGMEKVSETPINGENSPHRRFDFWRQPLADVKTLRKALGATVNDTVLTIVTGAFRDYLARRGCDPNELDFRIQTPVSMRSEEEKGKLGNRISAWTVPLPLDESDPRKQLERIRATTQELKDSRQALAVETMMSVMDAMPTQLLSLASRQAQGTVNSIVTNVPGPQFPLYLLGAELHGMYPQVPLMLGVGIGIALISYNGGLCWGFNADAVKVPDLGDFVRAIQASAQRVADACEVKLQAEAAA